MAEVVGRELLERVEAATGPNRGLDMLLARALVPGVVVMRQRDDDSGADAYTYWEYTGSIDDALALVERVYPGSFGVLQVNIALDHGIYQNNFGYELHHPMSSGGSYVQAFAPTAPLAILAALLKALAVSP